MLKKIRAGFFAGTLVVIPLILTFWFFYFIIDRLNILFFNPALNVLSKMMHGINIAFLPKLLTFFLLLLLLTLIGFAARIIVLRNIFVFGEKILYKVPMISSVYSAIKEISFAFFVNNNTIFKRVVLIEYPRKGLYQLGFVISETKGEVQQRTNEFILNVFIPTTPNPTSGMLVFVPKEDIIDLRMTVADAMKMVISGGAVIPRG